MTLYSYKSDGVEGTSTSRHLTNLPHTPVIEELVVLASKHTGLKADYVRGDQPYADMDFADVAEAYDCGYIPDPQGGSIYARTVPGTDMTSFWNELARLEALVKNPLDEPILNDDYLMYGGFWYVIDGTPKECDHFNGDENSGVHVVDYKRRYQAVEIRRCDMTGRINRLPAEEEETVSLPVRKEGWNSKGNHIQQNKRRPRSSNKIKKVL